MTTITTYRFQYYKQTTSSLWEHRETLFKDHGSNSLQRHKKRNHVKFRKSENNANLHDHDIYAMQGLMQHQKVQQFCPFHQSRSDYCLQIHVHPIPHAHDQNMFWGTRHDEGSIALLTYHCRMWGSNYCPLQHVKNKNDRQPHKWVIS